ncbi:glycine betaine ABC transporter substrate-binding protein, partial [Staphylococcus epidermidis]|uniref:glycine betaine ABC transporter substrate-binding protein n=1 Tax=Staphylococcus epidermidis TaxID=1282 RepID=UPI0034D96242
STYNLKLFKDHPPFFPPYHPTPLPSHQFLKHNPHLKPILKKLQPNISTEQIQQLNYQPHPKPKHPPTLPHHFFKKHHYFQHHHNKKHKHKPPQ